MTIVEDTSGKNRIENRRNETSEMFWKQVSLHDFDNNLYWNSDRKINSGKLTAKGKAGARQCTGMPKCAQQNVTQGS